MLPAVPDTGLPCYASSDSYQSTARFVHPAMHMPEPSAKPCPPSGPISSRQGMRSTSSFRARILE